MSGLDREIPVALEATFGWPSFSSAASCPRVTWRLRKSAGGKKGAKSSAKVATAQELSKLVHVV